LVIGAVAAGVALVVQTAGVIRSNRAAINSWLDENLAADLDVTSGSPVGASGMTNPISPALVEKNRENPGIDATMPGPVRKVAFRQTQILLLGIQLSTDGRRRLLRQTDTDLYAKLDQTPNAAIVSENFAALHRVRAGDVIPVASPEGEVKFTVLGAVPDF